MKGPSFKASSYDLLLIREIAARAVRISTKAGIPYDVQTAEMDITAVHANGTPLRLEDLAEFDDFNFTHDVFGIRGSLDRKTGRLTGHFLPRCAVLAVKP